MTRIYIIRHAEAEGNLYRRIHGHYDSLVTENGMRQIACLEDRFRDERIDAVYSSDLFRTKMTASAIYKSHGLPLVTSPRLREVCFGQWEDMPWGWAETFEKEKLFQFNYDPQNWYVPGCETYDVLKSRITSAFLDIAARHEGQCVAVVSHGSVIRVFLSHILGIKSEEIREVPPCENTGVTLLEVENGKIDIKYISDASHLPPDMCTLAKQTWWKDKMGIEGTNMRFVPMSCGDDVEKYMSYRADAWKTIHGSMKAFDAGLYRKNVERRAAGFENSVSMAYMGNEPVGVVELAPDSNADGKIGSVAFLYLKGDLRGNGYGVQLLGQAVSVLRDAGCETLKLSVAEENERAIRFYYKNGFIKTGMITGAVGMLYVMEKDIAVREITEGRI